jgi:hypothetical protein
MAIAQTNQRPAIVVIESLKRFDQYTSESSKAHLRALQELAQNSLPITADDDHDGEVQVSASEAIFAAEEGELGCWRGWR